MEKISKAADLILYDLKMMNDEKHRKFTGVSNRKILANLKFLSSRNRPVLVRLPLLPGINDDEENLNRTGEFLASLDTPCPIDLLPFHQGGLGGLA